MLFGAFFRRILDANICVTQFELALHAARTVDECWQALLETSRILGFSAATLRLHDRHLTATLAVDAPAECWSLTIPLDGAGHVDLSFPYRPGQNCATIGPLATSLRTVLAPKLHQLQFLLLPRAQAVAASD